MILSDLEIQAAIETGDLEIDPRPAEDQYTPSSVDLYLGGGFKIWDPRLSRVPGFQGTLDLANQAFQQTARELLVDAPVDADGAYHLAPGHFVLAVTSESVNLTRQSRLAGRIEGRSSLARLGLVVHLTAPTIHAGFAGNITLEMVNFGPFDLLLVPGRTRVCQLILERLGGEAGRELTSSFIGQRDPSGAS